MERPVEVLEVDLATLTIGTGEGESGPEGEGGGEGEGELERDDSEDAGDVHGGTLFRVPGERRMPDEDDDQENSGSSTLTT